ncbi:MAG: amino acid permease [Planctomycetota bacterium]
MTEAASPDANTTGAKKSKMAKTLGLWDVYAISTGAMFSAGFFLLPGLATAYSGPSTYLSYFLAGLLMIPALLSIAELSTALPRAGGSYYFLDRALGPAVGTIGGIGTWLALVLKSGFALLGMGAYLAITPYIKEFIPGDEADRLIAIKALAVALTVVFTGLNIFGAKESAKLQGILVIVLLGVLAFFVAQGLLHVFFELPEGQLREQNTPFFHQEYGLGGMFSTIGLVFVSYAGLTKVASVSEEVKRPDRNLPLGMILSLITATSVYVLGVFIMVAVLNPDELRSDLTPVATAADAFFDWLPYPAGLILIVLAALAAFASTGNAGIMAASRYPFAMSRDRLIPPVFEKLGRFKTPVPAILVTSGAMIFFIIVLDAEGVAKAASVFNLLVFMLINLAVIVMRESHITGYDPGFRSPLYPWTQILGTLICGWLVYQIGGAAIIITLGVVIASALWYYYYAQKRVERDGAIYHWFERLGQRRYDDIETEFREILKEKGARATDPFDATVARAKVVELEPDDELDVWIEKSADALAPLLPISRERIIEEFEDSAHRGPAVIEHGAMLPHFRLPEIERTRLVLARSRTGIQINGRQIHAAFFLVSPDDKPAQHLRVLGQLAAKIEDETFLERWLKAKDVLEIKEVLLREEQFLAIHLEPGTPAGDLINQPLMNANLPEGTLVAMVRRKDNVFVPRGKTVLRDQDRLTIIGDLEGIRKTSKRFFAKAGSNGDPASSKNGDAGAGKSEDVPAADPQDKS